MKTKHIATLALAALALTACEKTPDNPLPEGRTALAVTAGINTKATNDSWHKGDAIGIFALAAGTADVAEGVANFKYINASADGTQGNFSPADQSNTAYYPDNGDKLDVLAYYPHMQTSDGQLGINVTNQSSLPAIDLMTADKVTGKSKDAPDVALSFTHRLTKVNLNLTAGNGLGEIDLSGAKITIKGTPGSAVYDLLGQLFASYGEATDIVATGPTAILIPTAAGSDVVFIIEVDGKTFVIPLPQGIALVSGEEVTLTITLEEEKGEPMASISAMINPWTGGPTAELTAIHIEIPPTDMNIDGAITSFKLWKANNALDKRTYTLNGGNWTASPRPFYSTDLTSGTDFQASAVLGDGDPVTGIYDQLEASGTVASDDKLSLTFAHINAQIEFLLALEIGHTADLSNASINLDGYDGFKANAAYIIGVGSWMNKPLSVTLNNGNVYNGIARFTTEKGKKTVVTITLDRSTLRPAEINVTAVEDWGSTTPVDENAYVDLLSGNHDILSTLAPGTFVLTSGAETATYTYDGSNNLISFAPMNWSNLSSSSAHDFTLKYTSAVARPAADSILFSATNVAWGQPISFGSGTRLSAKFILELLAGDGYTNDDLKNLPITLEGFSTNPHPFTYTVGGSDNYAIVAPKDPLDASHKISIDLAGGHTHTIDLSGKFSKFEAGKAYTLKATMNKTGTTTINITEIKDWDDTNNSATGDFEYE
ncbi:hypothetical protein M2459_001123 [Parabacteroides sp. PF5-5]|uniref:fimbrillin family protein n=1 Tax=unclassified Parabacteroides TaxID=2649774 RepID=UPI0024764A0D|nr:MULTISPECIES: fimbrillin family protein [unclassified Parabacteroides]MDH6304390.1 hypothetical protein [Parabacteroides sp. PH5-39]MDH6315457.1 hypothetical protein [Parabacteroides sp. PF5-13]MDH6319049.1 hypothetical protein [Parabacteroides sp. PH5-13]MDH6322779.1 hypothetical protein [Parabacteroides sp. PH5-8]MDH6326649.1 hypothetical protein [Parabacteroides sp. PH5-41]